MIQFRLRNKENDKGLFTMDVTNISLESENKTHKLCLHLTDGWIFKFIVNENDSFDNKDVLFAIYDYLKSVDEHILVDKHNEDGSRVDVINYVTKNLVKSFDTSRISISLVKQGKLLSA